MDIKEYTEFSAKNDGFIASLFFLREFENLVRKRRPKRILEVGIGMGTIPYFVRHFKDTFEYVGTEIVDACIERLKINAPFVKLFKTIKEVQERERVGVGLI